jgi:hypothetical protein
MGYVAVAILVVLIVGVAVGFFVFRASRGQAGPATPDEGTPLGTTGEHHGEQSEEGHTVTDGERFSRTAGGTAGGEGGLGGEAEGERGDLPASKRPADRER